LNRSCRHMGEGHELIQITYLINQIILVWYSRTSHLFAMTGKVFDNCKNGIRNKLQTSIASGLAMVSQKGASSDMVVEAELFECNHFRIVAFSEPCSNF